MKNKFLSTVKRVTFFADLVSRYVLYIVELKGARKSLKKSKKEQCSAKKSEWIRILSGTSESRAVS